MVGMSAVIILILETLNLLLLFAGVLGYGFRENKVCLAAGAAIILFRGVIAIALQQEDFIFHRILAALVPAAAMPFFFKGRPSISLVVGITMVQVISMMDTLNIGIWTLAVKGDLTKVHLGWTHYLAALGCLVVLGVFSLAVRKKREEIYEATERISLWIFIPFLVCLWVLCYYVPTYVGNPSGTLPEIVQAKNEVRDGFIAFIIIGFLIVSCALVSKQRELKRMLLLNQRCIEEQAEQYRRQGEEDMELRRFRHDCNAHITAMQTLAEDGDQSRLREYVRGLSQQRGQKVLYNTNNLISDAILNRYGELCRETGIKLQVNGKFPDRISITDTELCVILSNAVKNAYEAAVQCDEGEITFEVRNARNFCTLMITNSCVQQLKMQGDLPVTTKADGKNHGIGTRNMLNTARKNGGSVTWAWDERGYVLVTILLRGE